jgi:TolB protein
VRAADGIATPLSVRSGSFGTPQWLDDKTVLVGVRDGSSQFLSLVDTTTGARRDLVSYTGTIRFQLNPAGTQVAYQVLPESGGGSSSNVAFPQTTAPVTVPQAAPNQLVVLDIASRTLTTIRPTPTSAFVWSPNSARLAYLTAEATDTYRWHFWSTQNTVDGTAYVPTLEFLRGPVALFDQYAQSVRWWSPDSAAFVYAGRAGPRTGIWVQQPQTGVAPVFVGDGDSAVWSPS